MRNTKISVILTAIIFTVFLSAGYLLAQNNSGQSTRQDQTGTSQNQQGNNNQQDQGNDKEAFRSTAQQLATDLVSRLNLDQSKANKIADILVDYRNDIADIKKDEAKNNMSGNEANGNNGNMVGSNNSDMQKFTKADKDANDKIESAIGKENVSQYMNIKKDWWKDVKDRAYSSVSTSGSSSDMNSGQSGSGTNSGTGTGTSGTGSGTGTSTDTSGSNRSTY